MKETINIVFGIILGTLVVIGITSAINNAEQQHRKIIEERN